LLHRQLPGRLEVKFFRLPRRPLIFPQAWEIFADSSGVERSSWWVASGEINTGVAMARPFAEVGKTKLWHEYLAF
jgi:hypothetical protein